MNDFLLSVFGALFSACNALGVCLWLSRTLLQQHTDRVHGLIRMALETFSTRLERVRTRVDGLERWQKNHTGKEHAVIVARLNRLERETGIKEQDTGGKEL